MKTVSEITGLRRMGPVALIDVNRDAWDALEALGMDPEAPVPDLNRVAFQQYARARRGGFFDPAIPWEDQTPHTRGKLIDCWELFLEYIGEAPKAEPITPPPPGITLADLYSTVLREPKA